MLEPSSEGQTVQYVGEDAPGRRKSLCGSKEQGSELWDLEAGQSNSSFPLLGFIDQEHLVCLIVKARPLLY